MSIPYNAPVKWVALVLFINLILPVSSTIAQVPEGEDPDNDLQSLLGTLGIGESMSEQSLEKRVEEIGELKLLHPLPVKFVSKAELKAYLQREFDEEYPQEEASHEAAFLEFLGLIPRGYNLRSEREQMLYENVAGFYDEKSPTKALYAVSSSKEIDFVNSLILSHEIRHAIQDQHFDLNRRLPDLSDFDDRKLAPLALYEGDATYIMMRFMGVSGFSGISEREENDRPGDGPFGDVGSLMGAAAAMAGGSYAAAPEVLQRQLLLPYIEGEKFIEAVHRRGGMSAVNLTLASPPTTSEQVLHPEKYFTHEQGSNLKFDASSEFQHQRPISEGVLGEFYIQCLFTERIREKTAAGWSGDYYQYYADALGKRTLIWKLAWDTPQDAQEFCDAWPVRCGTPLTSRGRFIDGRDNDGVALRIVHDGASTTLIKSDDHRMIARLSIQ